MKVIVHHLNFVFRIEVKSKSGHNFLISFFNLSKTRTGTFGTRVIYEYDNR